MRVGSEEMFSDGELAGASVSEFITGGPDFEVLNGGCDDIDGSACKGDPDGV